MPSRSALPKRVLHVIGRMNRGGAETWLMQVLRALDRSKVQADVLVHSSDPGVFDDEIRFLGSKVIYCPLRAGPVAYGARFVNAIRQHGPYDVVHSHVHHYTGYVLALAKLAGVATRIAHSHLDSAELDDTARVGRRAYLWTMVRALDLFATRGYGVSGLAGQALFGPQWGRDERWRLLHCGIDLRPFHKAHDRRTIRAELGAGTDDVLVGHVGRFAPQKNHAFLVEIARELATRDSRVRFALVGEGPLRATTETLVRQHGLSNRVFFAGLRGDIPKLLSAFDVFLLPSLREGLPLVGIEAQAAGVPIVLSDSITREVCAVPDLVSFRSLTESPSVWADQVLRCARGRRISQREALSRIEATDFNITATLEVLETEYLRGCGFGD